ncbi:MAG: diaminopimelate epimerase [Clostridiales bacterium]|nr:diaminopimelate epimerase [Clostridiales bacterium]
MKLSFVKMHGAGNDYIYFDCFKQSIDNPNELAIKLSDRHFGIGGDGIVLICPSDVADAKMRMFNADGSEGRMCGNAIRCVGKYIYDSGIAKKDVVYIETLSGIKRLELKIDGEKAVGATVDMGRAILEPEKLPALFTGESVINQSALFGGKEYAVTLVSMGNPHCVVFVDEVDNIEIEKIGPLFERSPLFPERINTEFIKILARNSLQMRVWERGSGETLACGTGACAAAVAACLNGHCDKGETVTVKLRGGNLDIVYTDESVKMTGAAEEVFRGEVEV